MIGTMEYYNSINSILLIGFCIVMTMNAFYHLGKLFGTALSILTLLVIVMPYHSEISSKEYEYITKVKKDYSNVVTINKYITSAFDDDKISLIEGAKILTLVDNYHYQKNKQSKQNFLEQKKELLYKAIN